MRKLILMTVLSVFSALAFAQETPAPEATTTNATEGTPGPSNAVEAVANKFGNWLGRMVQAPVGVAKSLASGVKSGYSTNSSASDQVSASASASRSETKNAVVEASAAVASAPSQADNEAKASSLRERFAGVLAMAQSRLLPIQRQAPAPVEDRSVRTVVTGSSLPVSSDADKN